MSTIVLHSLSVHKKKIIIAGSIVVLALIAITLLFLGIETTQRVLPQSQSISTPVAPQSSVDLELSQLSDRGQSLPVFPKPQVAPAVAITGCSLTTSLTPDATSIVEGGTVTYKMVIKNVGNQTCKVPSVSVYYSDNEKYVSSTPRASASTYYWKFQNMTSQEEKMITLTTKHIPGSEVTYIETEACATANNGNDACDTSRVDIRNGPTETPSPTPTVVPSPSPTPSPTPEPTTPPTPLGKEYGSWVWVSPVDMTPEYMNKIISGAAAEGINALYITIDDYLKINALPEGSSKEAEKKAYSDALEKFVMAANAQGIAVDAEAGWRDWAEATQKYKALAIVDYVKWYNASGRQKVRALQYDVEPYLLSTYERNKATHLRNFVQLIDETVQRLGTSDVKLSIVIPHFYDSTQKWTPAISYGGITTFTFDHLLRIVNTRPGSSIILMSYRNFAQGANSTIEISQTEVNQASASNSPTTIIVAQETGNVEPDYVTFFGTSKAYYNSQLSIINQTFNPKSAFGGISVHYIDPFLELK